MVTVIIVSNISCRMAGHILSEGEIEETVINLLSSTTEDEVLEFKEKKHGFDEKELGRYFSALSNEATLRGKDCAWIIFGVMNDRSVVGTDVLPTKESRMALRKDLADLMTNRITFIEIYESAVGEKRVLLFQIPSSPGVVVMYNGIAYGRDGESLVGLNLEKINRIQFRHTDWSAEIIDHTINDLDPDAIAYARRKYSEKNPGIAEHLAQWSDEEFLSRLNLTVGGKLTNAAALLLGKDYGISEHGGMVWISWILKDKNNMPLDYEHCERPFLLATEKVYSHITNLTYRRVMEGLSAEEMPTYDPQTLREAINNALIHSDYRKGKRIDVIEVQNECVIISNPGDFIPSSIDSIVLSDRSSSICRNQLIADTMYKLGLVDSIGLGIKKMFYSQIKRHFPLPEYTFDEYGVSLRLTGHVVSEAVARIIHFNSDIEMRDIMALDRYQKGSSLSNEDLDRLKRIKSTCRYGNELPEIFAGTHQVQESKDHAAVIVLTENQRAILASIEHNPQITTKDLSAEVGISSRSVRDNLKTMSDRGIIAREGTRKVGKWVILVTDHGF